jgi:hypothetical protein
MKRNEKLEVVVLLLPALGGMFILLFIFSIPVFLLALAVLFLVLFIEDPLDLRSQEGDS